MYYFDHGPEEAQLDPEARRRPEASTGPEASIEARLEADGLPEHDRPKRGRNMAVKTGEKKPSWLAQLRAALDTIGDEPDEEVTPDEVDDLDSETPDENVAEPDAEQAPDATPKDEVAPEAGAGVENAGEAAADDADETIPASEVSDAELREGMDRLASENERLRDLVTSLGGDPDAESEDLAEDVVEDEVDPEYDDEAAQADIDDQLRQIAELSRK